jgi:hypothetical protein
MAFTRGGRLALVLLSASLASLGGCATSDGQVVQVKVAPAGWAPGSLPRSGGTRVAAYDAVHDNVWVATYSVAENSLTLDGISAKDGATTSYVLDPDVQQYIGASVAADATGVVWVAWGDKLAKVQPADRSVHTYTLPDRGVHPSWDSPGLSEAVGIDVGPGPASTVAVLRNGSGLVEQFDAAKGAWMPAHSISGRAVATGGATVVRTEQGWILGGVDNGSAGRALQRATMPDGSFEVVSPPGRLFRTPLGAVSATIDGEVSVIAADGTTMKSMAMGTQLSGLIPIATLGTSAVAGVSTTSGHPVVVVMDLDTGGTKTFALPLGQVTAGGPNLIGGPHPESSASPGQSVPVNPRVETIVGDGLGRVWVFTNRDASGWDGIPSYWVFDPRAA